MANTKIVLNRQSDLILDKAQIINPEGIVIADISGLVSTVESIDAQESTNMSTEASARAAEDKAIRNDLSALEMQLSTEVSTESSNRVEGDVSVTSAMSAEISSRIVAETSLANDIEAEASTGLVRDQAEASMARAAEQSVATDLIAEQSRAESAEVSLNAKVENVISNVDPAALDSLTEIVGAFQSADGDLNGAITALGSTATAAVDAEASIRLSADESIAANLSSELVDRAAAVSTEEAARISGDVSVALDLSSEIQARISDVDAEQARAESAEASLNTRVYDVFVEFTQADSSIAAALSTEISNRINDINSVNDARDEGDISLEEALSAEVVRAESAELSLSNLLGADVSAEASIRLAADDSISANLSTELVDRAAADASIEAVISDLKDNLEEVEDEGVGFRQYIDPKVDDEISSRESADASLEALLSSEIVNREDVVAELETVNKKQDKALNDAIDAEASLRTAGDLSLEVAVSAEQARVDAILLASDADKDSFAEIVTLINSVDTTNDEAFASYVLSNNAALAEELVERAAADASIASELSSEIVNREDVVAELESTNKKQDKALNDAIDELEAVNKKQDEKAGYYDRGDASASHFDNYLEASNEFQSASEALQQAKQQLSELETIISDLHAEKAAKEAEGDANAVAKIEAEINNYISERDEVENMISEIQDDSAFEFEAFMPINEVNFEAWKSVNESLLFEEVTSKLNKDLQDEISRAISVEAELDIKVTDIIENTDVSKIDSFVEVINEFNKVSAANFDSIYAKKVAITFDGDDEATLANPVKPESLQVYINGLMVELGGDYTEQVVDGAVSVVQFTGDALDLVQAGAKLGAYGVYGEFSNISFIGIDFAKLIADAQKAVNDLQVQKQSLDSIWEEDRVAYDEYVEVFIEDQDFLNVTIAQLNKLITEKEAEKDAAMAAGDTKEANEAIEAIQLAQELLKSEQENKSILEMEFEEAKDKRTANNAKHKESIKAIDTQISTLNVEIDELQAQRAAAEA